MSKKFKSLKKKAKIIRKQTQKFCFHCILPCSIAFVVVHQQLPNEQIKEVTQATTKAVA